ncbi:phage tail protein [Streptococcus suis]|uniref:phage tail protein n=2 Tax=Streptococcus suis TaxID=1307 RepID=UPI002FCA7718
MLTFLDHKGNEIGALTTFKYTNSVNGERSLSGAVHGNLEIEKGWGVRFEDEYYKVIYAKPKSLGKINIVQFDAVHQFFWDFDKSSVYSELDGSYPFQTFLDHIFNGSGYRYNLEVEVGSLRKQNFGLKKRLELFNDLIKHAGVEFQVRGKVVRILERTGTDLSTVVRKKLNLNDLSIEKRIGDFITYQKGLGAWHDENDHSKGRLEVEYVSPLATIYGRLEGEPYIDERFTIAKNFLEVLKKTVEDSYSISVQLAMEDLQKAGYRYTKPLAGDYITVIDEDINFKERVRIVSFETKYDVKGQVIDHTVTCNDIGSVKKQSVGYSSLKSSVANVLKETESAIQTANRALVSADGKKTVYFGAEFPQDIPKGTLTKGDTLYLEVGDTTKTYYWNGAEWLEPPVVNDVEAFKESINTEIAQVNQSMQAQSEEHDRQVADILSKTQSVEELANQAKADAANALSKALQYKNEAIAEATRLDTVERQATEIKLATAKSQAISEATRLVETAKSLLSGQIANVSTDLSQTKEAIKLLATKTTVDTLTGRVSSAEAMIQVQADQISQRVKTSDFDQAKQRISTAESSITQLGNRITTEISETAAKIPKELGIRNLIKGTKDLSGNNPNQNTSDTYLGFNIARSRPSSGYVDTFRVATTINATATAYVTTFYARSDVDGFLIDCHLFSPNTTTSAESSTGHKTKAIDGLVNVRLTTEWKRYWVKWTQTPVNEIKTLIVGRNRVERGNATVEIAGVALYEGDMPKDWSPAPEDAVTEIENVKTIITQTAEGQQQLSTRLIEAQGKITTAETNIRQLISDVSSKVSQTDYNTLTGRVDSAETAITQNATEISKRLTKTQVDKAITDKGYQTKSDVDSNITGRGYITSSALQPYALAATVQTLVRETADSFSRTISETKALIPTEAGGRNLIRGSSEMIIGSGRWQDGTFRKSGTGNIKTINISNPPVSNVTKGIEVEIASATECGIAQDTLFLPKGTYTFTVWVKGPTGATGRIDTFNGSGAKSKVFRLTGGWDKVTVTNTSTVDETKTVSYVYLINSPGYPAKMHLTAPKLETGTIPTDYTLAIEDLVTVTALHNVTDKVDSHTRTIGAVGETGSILDNVSKVTQTAAGLVQEVSGTNGLKTQVSQLSGSYAIKNLTKAGDVLGQINLNPDGSVRINEGLISVGTKTYIQDGVITSAKIAGLDAGKITTGTLDAARIKANSIDGSKLVFDQAFVSKMTANEALFKQLFAQSAFITSVQAVAVSAKQIVGGIAEALNGGMDVNFDESKINFYTNVAAIRRIYTGHPTQFIKFETEGNYSRTIIGSNRNGGEVFNSATFAGIVVENTNNINTEDNVRIYGDNTLLRHAQGDVGWNINSVTQRIVPANMNAESEIWSKHFVAPDKNSKPVRLDTAVAALWDIWNHIIYNNFEFNAALRTHIKARRDNWKFELNL